MPAIEAAKLASVDLTTVAKVNESIDTSMADTSQDAYLATVITAVSDRITQYLGFHTLSASRTETYEGRRFERVVTLDGQPVTTFTSLKYHSESDFTGVLAETTTAYTVHKRSGWIRLDFAPIYKNNYFQVVYTSGLGTTADAVVSNYPEISLAATMQCKYFLQRRDSMGGNITTGAGSTSFETEYTLQKEVRMILDQYARR